MLLQFIWQNYKYLYRQPNKTPFFCEGCIIITGEHYPDMPFYCLGVNKDRDPGTITVAGSLLQTSNNQKGIVCLESYASYRMNSSSRYLGNGFVNLIANRLHLWSYGVVIGNGFLMLILNLVGNLACINELFHTFFNS